MTPRLIPWTTLQAGGGPGTLPIYQVWVKQGRHWQLAHAEEPTTAAEAVSDAIERVRLVCRRMVADGWDVSVKEIWVGGGQEQ